MVHAAIVALLTSFESLAQLTNVGALFVVAMISGVVLWRRYYQVRAAQYLATRMLALLALIAVQQPASARGLDL